jgi:Tn3 transposase DDE domain
VKFYTHVSDRYAPFHSKVIAANASEAAHVLDGLMHHESSLDIREHYTDTAGAIDHVFGLCHLLGFRFAPRIRDLADRRLYIVGARTAYKALDPLIGGTQSTCASLPRIGTSSCVWRPRSKPEPSRLRRSCAARLGARRLQRRLRLARSSARKRLPAVTKSARRIIPECRLAPVREQLNLAAIL